MPFLKKHICLLTRGNGPGCPKCHILQYGYCESFLHVLEKKINSLNRRSDFNEQDRQDIISEFVISIVESVNQFEGRRNAKFSTWANSVFHNKLKDYKKKLKAKKRSIIIAVDNLEEQENKSISIIPNNKEDKGKELIDFLLNMISQQKDRNGCCQLFINYYEWGNKGLNQKEMAKQYGIKSNTFNQRLTRCRKILFQLFKMNNYQSF